MSRNAKTPTRPRADDQRTWADAKLIVPSRDETHFQPTKKQELRSFLFLTVVMAPVLTGVIIAGYGFLVWMYQIIAGPPTGG